jgi:hypothetical protein
MRAVALRRRRAESAGRGNAGAKGGRSMSFALTLHQPWASLVFARVKRHETRSFKPYAVLCQAPWVLHAASRPIGKLDETLERLCELTFGERWRETLPRGAGLGRVSILRYGRTEDPNTIPFGIDDRHTGDWSSGRFAWELKIEERFNPPIFTRGKQGVWRWKSGGTA